MVDNAPIGFSDSNGLYVEAAAEVLSIGLGTQSAADNFVAGNYADGIADSIGVGIDIGLAFVPLVPGITGLGIKAYRARAAERKAARAARAAEKQANKKSTKQWEKMKELADKAKADKAAKNAKKDPCPTAGTTKEGPALPDNAWDKKAPKNVTPGTRELEQQRYNPKTGKLEDSSVRYDEYGRQTERTDYSDHGYPGNHTNPHTHKTMYNDEFPTGKSERINDP